MYYNKLLKKFKDRDFDNVYLFLGNEKYIIDKIIDYLKKSVIDKKYKDFNLNEIDYNKSNISDVLAKLETLPFMSDYAFTIVKNIDNIDKDISEKEFDELVSYLKKPNESSVVFFISTKLDKRKKFYKEMKKRAELVEFSKLNNRDFTKWINKYLRDNGKSINNKELNYLVNMTGYAEKKSKKTLYDVVQSLEKIINYSKDPEINKEIIDKFIEKPIEENIFLLIDSLFNKKTSTSLDILNLMDNNGEPLIVVLFMIIKQFREIYKMKILLNAGLTSKKSSTIIGMHPYAGQKTAKHCKRLDYKTLNTILEKSLEVDRRSKTTSVTTRLLIENYISDLVNLIK